MLDSYTAVNRQDSTHFPGNAILGCLEVLLARVQFLMLAALAWEEDESCFVGLEALDVCGEGFGGQVLATRVDRDTDRRCKFAGDTSFL